MLPINPLTELLVSQLVQISVRPAGEGPSAEVIAFVQYSPIADLMGNRLINPVHDVEHRTAARLVGIFEDNHSAESVFLVPSRVDTGKRHDFKRTLISGLYW
jgi:hypothetical protein